MINFNAVDFSECRSEEVISFFLRSVYEKNTNETVFFPTTSVHIHILELHTWISHF